MGRSWGAWDQAGYPASGPAEHPDHAGHSLRGQRKIICLSSCLARRVPVQSTPLHTKEFPRRPEHHCTAHQGLSVCGQLTFQLRLHHGLGDCPATAPGEQLFSPDPSWPPKAAALGPPVSPALLLGFLLGKVTHSQQGLRRTPGPPASDTHVAGPEEGRREQEERCVFGECPVSPGRGGGGARW